MIKTIYDYIVFTNFNVLAQDKAHRCISFMNYEKN